MLDGLRQERNWLRNLGATSFLVAAAAAVIWLGWVQIPRTVTGTISWSEDPGYHPVAQPQTIRLCSVERVFQTNSDGGGHFTFLDVPGGTYQLSPPRDWLTAEIETGIGLTTVVAINKLNRRYDRRNEPGLECNRDTTHEWFKCGVEYIVEYGPRRARKSALILGLIEEYRPGGQKLAGANVLLTNVKDQALHYSTVSDNGGRFRFAPPPGIYVLTMSQQGVFDVVVPDFLVPQENDTMVRLQTEKTSAPHFCE